MTIHQWILIAIIGIPLIFTAINRLRMDLAALLMAVLLAIFQYYGLAMLGPAGSINDTAKVIAGFGQPVVITLISLFVITRGLEKSGMMSWLAHRIIHYAGGNPRLLIALLSSATAFLSLFMNNVAAGALIIPCALQVSKNTGIKPGKLLIPVAYGSLLGGMATYFTTANIIMSDLLRISEPPQQSLQFLDFTPTGGLIAVGGILFLALVGNKTLPDSQPAHDIQTPIPASSTTMSKVQAIAMIIITLIAVIASVTGIPVYLSMLAAAVLVMLLNLVTVQEAYRAIEWPVIFLIAGMYVVSLAIVQTGLAALVSQKILQIITPFGAIGVAATAFLLAALINQVIGGQVTAYVVGPIVLTAAIHLGVNAQAVAVATAIGCSASFLTPFAHPVNMLMVAPGGYQFSDFFKTGWMLMIITFILVLVGLKVFWNI